MHRNRESSKHKLQVGKPYKGCKQKQTKNKNHHRIELKCDWNPEPIPGPSPAYSLLIFGFVAFALLSSKRLVRA